MKVFVRTALVAFLWTATVWAQATSQIAGTVTDPSGGVIPGAVVKVTQTDTGLTRSMTSNGEGNYVLTNLPVGPYKMEVAKDGFKTFVEDGIVLEVNTNPSINPTLKIGAVSDQVTVEAETLTVE